MGQVGSEHAAEIEQSGRIEGHDGQSAPTVRANHGIGDVKDRGDDALAHALDRSDGLQARFFCP